MAWLLKTDEGPEPSRRCAHREGPVTSGHLEDLSSDFPEEPVWAGSLACSASRAAS